MKLAVNLERVKDKISDRLLDIDEVNGVSIEKDRVIVYVVDDSPKIRDSVAAVLASEGGGVEVDFIVSDGFTAF